MELTLEQRVSVLEQEMAGVMAQQKNGTKEKPWLRTLGAFAGDEAMKEIFDEAMKIREKDRRKASRRGKKRVSQRAKK